MWTPRKKGIFLRTHAAEVLAGPDEHHADRRLRPRYLRSRRSPLCVRHARLRPRCLRRSAVVSRVVPSEPARRELASGTGASAATVSREGPLSMGRGTISRSFLATSGEYPGDRLMGGDAGGGRLCAPI